MTAHNPTKTYPTPSLWHRLIALFLIITVTFSVATLSTLGSFGEPEAEKLESELSEESKKALYSGTGTPPPKVPYFPHQFALSLANFHLDPTQQKKSITHPPHRTSPPIHRTQQPRAPPKCLQL